jgi:uncharacterized membrane protein YedE/YeeE
VQVDWQSFTPGSALLGGALIGLAASGMALLMGRIAGISGIVAGVLRGGADLPWRVAFLVGMLASAATYSRFLPLPPLDIGASGIILASAGFVVGIGTQYGSGCTSGHGVCGLSRLSPRSLVATALFMASGFATVFVMRHVLA